MKSFWTLTKLLFKLQFRANATTDKKKKGGTVAAFVVLGIIFVPMLVGIAVVMHGIGGLMGANQGVVAFLILCCQALVLILGISSLVIGVFMPRDADKLMYLPIKSSTIFASKLTVAYLNEVITTALAILFVLLPYGIGAGLGVGFYLMLIPSLFLIPLLPILLGTIIAMPIALLLSRVGNSGVGKTIVTTVFFLVFMGGYFALMFSVMGLESNFPADTEPTLEQLLVLVSNTLLQLGDKMIYVHTNYVLAGSLVSNVFAGWIANFALTICEFAVLGALTLLIARPFYKYMLANQVEGGGGARRNVKIKYESKPTSVLRQLVVTDFKRTLRDSQMGFQAFAGLIMMPLIVIIFGVGMYSGEMDGEIFNTADIVYQLIAPVVLVAYLTLLGAGSNALGMYPITRENKSFYILKSLPISFNKILTAKVILSTIVMVAVYLVTTIVAVIVLKVEWYFGVGMMFVMTLTGFGSQCLTTKMDLKDPKFGWTNFNQSLKNAKNSWIAMLIGLLVMIVVGGISALFIILYVATQNTIFVPVMWIVLTFASFLFAFVSYKIMVSNSQALFERIEA